MGKFIITEDEKYQILNLYKDKKIIIEQNNKVAYNQITSSETDKGFNFFTTNERAKNNINYVGSANYNKTLQNKKLIDGKISKNDTESIKIWNEIYENNKIFAANTINYVQRNTWVELVSFRDKIESNEDKGKPLNELNPSSTVSIPAQALTNFYFQDNMFDLTDAGKTDLLTQIIRPLITQKGNKEGCIDLIQVDSSASRYRNTDQAINLSFKELSQKRNDSVRTFILQQLNSNGFNQWCKGTENVVQNVLGSNNDGTSGPNPPSPTPYIIKGQEKMEPKATDETKRNEFGSPHSSPQEYNIYKYSRPTVRVAFNENTPENPTETPKMPVSDTDMRYVVEFKGNVGELKTPGSTGDSGISTKIGKTNRNEVKTGLTSCPVFKK